MISGSITLTDVAARTRSLIVACPRCNRAESYNVAELIRHYGRRRSIPDLLLVIFRKLPPKVNRRP
jgi:hypothetical protein